MKTIWNIVQKLPVKTAGKYKFFLFTNMMFCSLIGFAVWLALHHFILNTWDWAVCFAGYSCFFIGFLGGLVFLYGQENK